MELTTSWFDAIAEVPPVPLKPRHISQTREWMQAWEGVRTEHVRCHRHLLLSGAASAEIVSYFLVDHSPLWASYEQDAQVDAVWDGPVVYAPSLYGEYGGAGGSRPEFVAEAVDRGLELATGWGARGLVFTNLTPDIADRWRAARAPDVDMLFDRAYSAPVAGFLSRLPRKLRLEFGRQWRRAGDAGMSLSVRTGDGMLPVLPEFTALATEAAEKHGDNLYGIEMFRELRHADRALLLIAEQGGSMAGGFYCFRYRNRLYLWTAGLDYSRMRSMHTYGFLVYESLRHAERTGAEVLDPGRGNFTYKERLGFRGEDLRTFVYLTAGNPGLRQALRRMDKGLQEYMYARVRS